MNRAAPTARGWQLLVFLAPALVVYGLFSAGPLLPLDFRLLTERNN